MTASDPTVDRSGSTASTVIDGTARATASLRGALSWEEVTDGVLADLPVAEPPDLTVVFVDSRFGRHLDDVLGRLQTRLRSRHLIGCVGQSVIGSGLEAEDASALSVMTLSLPGATLTPVIAARSEDDANALDQLERSGSTAVLMFADPFSTHIEQLLSGLQERMPGLPVVGGMASSHNQAEGIAVFLDGVVHRGGAVLMGLEGVAIESIVAQGAVPLGRPLTITACDQNTIATLGSRPALEVLRETLGQLDEATRTRATRNLLVGLAMDEYQDEHGRGDFLIRNLLGVDQESGTIAVNTAVRVGQTFQFQFRDAEAADADLRQRLHEFAERLPAENVVLGSVLCACNGRGRGLFGELDHDARALSNILGPVPTAGLFCNGEIGPVGRTNFLHGFTASIAVITAPRVAAP